MEDFDDLLNESQKGYPAKKQHKHKPKPESEITTRYPVKKETVSAPKTVLETDEDYNTILSKMNNFVLVDFDISMNVGKKKKIDFKASTRRRFTKYLAAEHQDELKAKGFDDEQITKMANGELDLGNVNGKRYSVHHKFPRFYAEASGINYNSNENLILVEETGLESGDDAFHKYMDKQLNEIISRINTEERPDKKISDQESLGKYLEKHRRTIKLTVPWPVGSVYLTEEQQKRLQEIKKEKGEDISTPRNIVAEAEAEIVRISPSYAERAANNSPSQNLQNARLAKVETKTDIMAIKARQAGQSR